MLYHCEHVSVALAGVEQIGQRVYYGEPRIFRERVNHILSKCPYYYAVQEPSKDFRSVLDRLAARYLQVVRLQYHRIAAKFINSGFERQARASALFEEHKPPALPAQYVEHARRAQFLIAVRQFKHFRRLGDVHEEMDAEQEGNDLTISLKFRYCFF